MNNTTSNTMTTKVWLLLLSLSLLWGGSFLFIEFALQGFKPLTIVALRVSIAAIFLHGVLRYKKIKFPWNPKNLWLFAIMGAINNVIPFSSIVWGQQTIEAGRASILNSTVPLFTVVLAHWLLKNEKLTGAKLIGVALGFMGVLVLTGPSAFSIDTVNSVVGQIAILVAAVSYAFASIFGKKLNHLDPLISAAGMLTASAVIMIPITLLLEPVALNTPTALSVAAIVFLGFACTALAYLLYFKILLQAGSSNLSLVTFLIPPSAMLMGVIFLNESITWQDAAGLCLILAGMAIATGLYKRFINSQ